MLVDTRFLGREHRCSALFDVELDQVSRVFREICVFCKDHRDRLADIAHDIFRQHRLAVGLESFQAGEPERDRRNVRDIGARPHRVHAGQLERRARVDRF